MIRANVADELAVSVTNGLDPRPSALARHRAAQRHGGATPATPNTDPSSNVTYRFSAPHPGTYWAHPHTGLDADYGLYVPVIIDDPAESGRYDAEWIVVLDDWTDGITARPGQRIRMRIINAASDTAFRVALAGHLMTVTHTDGFPVVPTDVDALLLGMG